MESQGNYTARSASSHYLMDRRLWVWHDIQIYQYKTSNTDYHVFVAVVYLVEMDCLLLIRKMNIAVCDLDRLSDAVHNLNHPSRYFHLKRYHMALKFQWMVQIKGDNPLPYLVHIIFDSLQHHLIELRLFNSWEAL